MQHAAPDIRRRRILVDAKMQFAIILPMVGVLAALAGVYLLTFVISSAEDLGPNSDATRRLGILVSGAYFLVALIATFFAGLIATHRVAGPARLLEQAVRGMRENDWDRRLRLRDRDHLQSLAHELSLLRDELRREEERRREFRDRLEVALARGDYQTARELAGVATVAETAPAGESEVEA